MTTRTRNKQRPKSRVLLSYRFERWVARTRFSTWVDRPWAAKYLAPVVEKLSPSLRDYAPPLGPKSLEFPELPPELRGSPGIPRDRAAAEKALAIQGPFPVFQKLHKEATEYFYRNTWRVRLLISNKKWSSLASAETDKSEAVPRPRRTPEFDPAELTAMLKAKAAELGISAVGVTQPDPTVMFTNGVIKDDDQRVVVGILEQNWEATQSIPSRRAYLAHFGCSLKLREQMLAMSQFLIELGYTARIDTPRFAMVLPYAVEAGLGQMGLNGQLLTPFCGSRSRIQILLTNAPLVLDSPVDYGVEKICDSCRSCVRNCPSGAIRQTREWHRGVYKAPVKPDRCLPVVSIADDCGICQKVCPVQRYGLPAVIDEFKKTGKILGKDTDELEGYKWPVDGKFYGAGKRPPVREQGVLGNPDFLIDLDRWEQSTLTAPPDTEPTPNRDLNYD